MNGKKLIRNSTAEILICPDYLELDRARRKISMNLEDNAKKTLKYYL